MTNEILLSDRAGTVIRETLVPHLQKNFFRLSNKPWLRYLGLNFSDDGAGAVAVGSDEGRVQKVQTMGVYNNQFKIVHETTAFGGGVQAADEREALENGGYTAQRSIASLKTIQGQFDITQQALDALEGQGGVDAFVNEVYENSKGAVHRVHKEINRQCMGHVNSALCYIDGTTSSSTTVTVKSNATGAATNETTPTRHIHKGDKLWVGTKAQIEANSGYTLVTVAAEPSSTTVFTITVAKSLTDAYLVVRQAAYSLTYTRYKELTGFAYLINNTGTVQNIDKSANAWFASYVANIAGNVALTDVDNMLNNIREFSMNPADIFLIGNQKQWTRYAAKLVTTRYLDHSEFEGKLAGGLEGLTVYSPDGNLPFFIDNDIDDGVIYAIDPNAYMLGYVKLLNFLPRLRSQTVLEEFFAFYTTCEMAQKNALSSGKLYGITG